MRCVICDKSSQGLSDYHPMGRVHGHKFSVVSGDVYCEECTHDIDETLNEMYDNELDKDQGAFEYE